MQILVQLCVFVLAIKKASCGGQFAIFHREHLDDKICPLTDRVFDKPAKTAVQCATLCQSNEECTRMIYSRTQKYCYGCKLGAGPWLLVNDVSPTITFSKGSNLLMTCADILTANPDAISGVYPNKLGMELYCDMDTDGGGWTVFQKRFDKSLNFYQNWNKYKHGFGNMSSEFWFGLENLTKVLHLENRQFNLRIDLEDNDGSTFYAVYQNFSVSGEDDKYRLLIGDYSGTAGNNLLDYSGTMFTTKDADNDEDIDSDCSLSTLGGWWYRGSLCKSLNNQHGSYAILWTTLSQWSLQKSSMKFR